MKGPAANLTSCPFGGCQQAPIPMFCVEHWPRISGVTRGELVKQWKKLTGAGTKTPPKRFIELLGVAVREIGRA